MIQENRRGLSSKMRVDCKSSLHTNSKVFLILLKPGNSVGSESERRQENVSPLFLRKRYGNMIAENTYTRGTMNKAIVPKLELCSCKLKG